MALETLALEHVPAQYAVHVALFQDVRNADFLHKQLLARNAAFEYAFIDASIILSRTQLLSAVFKAINAQVTDSLKTPNVHSEIVISLNPSSNIADAYRRFGISPATKSLVAVKVTFPTDSAPVPPSADEIWKHLSDNVEGIPLPASDDNLRLTADMSKIRKYYKLNVPWLEQTADETIKQREMETLVLGAMALRGL